MIKLLIGEPGSGKTKVMIQRANEILETARGNIVFIGESDESILEVNHNIRYINASEFPLESSNEFIAFLYGLLSSNYDIETMYLDGILNIYVLTPDEICSWVNRIKLISDKFNVNFVISITTTGDVPDCLKSFL